MYKTVDDLVKDNPEAITSKDGDYFERPKGGWNYGMQYVDDRYFNGIGYHGNTTGDIKDGWKSAPGGLGHIPDGGYG